MNKKIVAAVLSGVLAGGILVSAGSIMADTTDTDQQAKPAIMEMRPGGGGMRGHGVMGLGFMGKDQEGLATILDELVADGTISQAKADQISDFITEKAEEMKAFREEMKNMTEEEREAAKEDGEAIKVPNKVQRDGILTELVDNNIITQDEADAIQEKLQEKMTAQREEMAAKQKEMREEKYHQLVDAGLISQEQADKLLALTEEKQDQMQAEREEIKDMTSEKMKDKVLQVKKGGYLADAVEAGIITQEEADSIRDYEQKQAEAKGKAMMEELLAKLVEDKVITQDQVDPIKDFLAAKAEERKTEMEKIMNMKEEERKVYFEKNKSNVKGQVKKIGINIWGVMVEEGVISQDQAEKLAEYMPKLGDIRYGN